MNQRLELIKDSLQVSDIDSIVYSMITDMSANEWLYALENKDKYEIILPFLLIAYDNKRVDELIELTSLDYIVTELMEQWFSVYFFGDYDLELIDVNSVADRPCLNALYSGHLLSVFAKSSHGSDASDFIREYTRALTRKLLGAIKDKPEHTLDYLAGTVTPNSAFPVLSDWDESELEESLNFLYFLSSVELAVELLGFGDGLSLKRRELLSEGKIEEVIETSSHGSLQKRRHIRDYPEVEAFVVSCYEKYEYALSDFILENNEIVFLEALLAQGKISSQQAQDQRKEQGLGEQDRDEAGNLDAALFGSLNENKQEEETQRGFIESLKGMFLLFKSNGAVIFSSEETKVDSDDVPSSGAQASASVTHEASDFNELVKTRKKKGSSWAVFLAVGGLSLILLLVLINKVNNDQTSIIDQHSEEANNDYQVVFIDE